MALILAANAGSSSLKISLYAVVKGEECPVKHLLGASVSSISSPPVTFSFAHSAKDQLVDTIHDHASAFAHFLDRLDGEASIKRSQIRCICHRVVHGGNYTHPVRITEETYHHIEELSSLAPLHNGAALSVIQACLHFLPHAKSIAYFDTSFHSTIPLHISTYAIDQEIARKRGLRKYGFHGLSYSFILRTVSKFLDKSPTNLNLIVLHLGSGASACAIRNGLSLDTSMGLTPLQGLPGATRSGTIDPSLIFHYTSNGEAEMMSHDQAQDVGVSVAEEILNRKAGWKAICGTTNFGEVVERAELGRGLGDEEGGEEVRTRNPYRLAFDLFVDRIVDYIGAYHVKLGAQVDALVFAGGIGERSVQLRSVVGRKVLCLGYNGIDEEKNRNVGEESKVIDITREYQTKERGRILVVRTDEQLEMARQCSLDNNQD